ncbi:hypothetical protein [Nostoc punctiforme]|uniref:Uncharacterized protein n=1 Tax=Nostoc punctiforme (strain ATCC 29133 / PCC 73102) TaxID=63737 RepID=B2J2N8_NOSP7|nr:hypothetical protein [Nostoc punctiforme]ACC80469.1 hypothetical protein Npun_R1807 [Nostoc punctiforme PCC 73102]
MSLAATRLTPSALFKFNMWGQGASMSGDEITPNDEAIELSDEELDDLAGGFNLQFTSIRSHRSTRGFSQQTSRGRGFHSKRSAFHAETTDSSVFHLSITDATTEDLKVLGELFGDISAIEGST